MEREELNQLVEQARGGNSAAITSLVKAYHHQVKDKIRSAGVPEEDQKNALNVGMNGHIAKPLDIQKLFQVLSELLK